jgi:MFS family permease
MTFSPKALTGNTARLVLAACFAVLLVNAGSRFTIGLVLKPMAEDLDWSRTTLASAVTLFMFVAAIALPVTGRLVDRFGAKCVLGSSMLLGATGLACVPFLHEPWQFAIAYGVVFAVGSAGTSITPIGVLLSHWYPDRLGMANSIAISGMGLGQLLVISVLAGTVAGSDWRDAYLFLAMSMVVVLIPIVFMPGRRQQTVQPAPNAAPATDDTATLAATLRKPRMMALLAVYAICGFQDFLVATHIVAFALDEGVSAPVAGQMLAFMGLCGLAGVLATGWLNDRFGPVLPTAGCFVVRIVIFMVLSLTQNETLIVTGALLYGMTFWITAPLTVVFTRQLVGAALLGTVSGTITMVHHGFGGVGALVGAQLFDRAGNYDGTMWVMALTSIAGLIGCVWLRPKGGAFGGSRS